MARIKERRKFIHKPSTQEIFLCLSSMLSWSAILFDQGPKKEYRPLLERLIDAKYFEPREDKMTIKAISSAFNIQSSKVTKWLHEIYNDILDLNLEQPLLFTGNKNKTCIYCNHYDSSATIYLGLDLLPRQYEYFTFYFLKGKVGTDNFWVSRVDYEVREDGVQPTVWLNGGILNKYREMAIEEALFKRWIGFMDMWHKNDHEIDEILRQHLR
ncbi:MAG: hypothetical protein ACO1OO_09555 [Flavisolibacter sp.]